jgi:uncharacterized membrane protein
LFSFLHRKKKFFKEEESRLIMRAIADAEHRTSGEVRVYVESHCSYMDAIDRAAELFHSLKMYKTAQRNAVLVYVAMKDRQLAVFGDEGIHQRVGEEYWKKVVGEMLAHFNSDNHAEGISHCVRQVGEALHENFPYDKGSDKNELPDDIVYGR